MATVDWMWFNVAQLADHSNGLLAVILLQSVYDEVWSKPLPLPGLGMDTLLH